MKKFEDLKDTVINDIKSVFKENLISIIIYGSYVRGGYLFKRSDINLMIIRKERNNQELMDLNKFLKKYSKKLNLALPMVLTEKEIKTSTDVYPMEYSDIKENNQVLFGQDVFGILNIEHKNLRLELENQVKSKLIYLRGSLVSYYRNNRLLKLILRGTLSSLVEILKNILRLNRKDLTNDLQKLSSAVSELAGTKLDIFMELQKFKTGEKKYSKKDEFLALFKGVIQNFEVIADYVDKFKVNGAS